MKLYKAFNRYETHVEVIPTGVRIVEAVLRGLYSGVKYHDKRNNKMLTATNAVGFKFKPIKGRLQMCRKGYHAWEAAGLRWYLAGIPDPGNNNIYEVKLIGMQKRQEPGRKLPMQAKRVGRDLRILRKVAPWELKRLMRDPRRSHKKRVS